MLDELESCTKHQDEKNIYWWTIEYSVPVSSSNMNFNEERLSTIAEMTQALGSYFFTEGDAGTRKLFMRADYDQAINIDELCSNAKNLLSRREFEGIDLSRCYKTSSQPWETQHFDAFPPLNVGKSLVVMAPWHAKEEIQP